MCLVSWEQFCSQRRVWIRPLMIIFYALFVIIIVPLLIVNSVKDGFTRKDQLILIGGLFVLTALPISFWQITQHIVHFTKPILQKHIIRILWMVPIYALNAWLGLLYPAHAFYMDSIRECYEAYVIYNFMVYLLNYLNLEMDLEATMQFKPQVKHIFPLCCMRPWEMGAEFIHNCKHGILQYTVVRPITTFLSVICELSGVYGQGTFKGNVAYPYITAVNNVTQFVAMYCLVLFYQANKVELRPMRPLPKFLCIKAVVFFSFFQGVVINILVYFGFIENIFGSNETDDYLDLSTKLQNFLICIEMFLAAIAHHYSFSHDPFHINIPHYATDRTWLNAFCDMWDITDVQRDVTEHLGVVGSSLSRRLRGRTMYQLTRGGINSESEYLIQLPQPNSVPLCYQSSLHYTGYVTSITNTAPNKNRYGAIDSSHTTVTTEGESERKSETSSTTKKHDGINIVRNQNKEYSPHHGAPKSGNLFNMTQSQLDDYSSTSNSGKNYQRTNSENNTSSKSEGTSSNTGTGTDIKKSDSNTSDWLSSPADEILGIDVKGLEKDRINYNDPKV